ncbi:putative centrosome-associated protein [Sesbania bispinosa]|nr:putative centrosome-associated protein [Sesbania bispinosa]
MATGEEGGWTHSSSGLARGWVAEQRLMVALRLQKQGGELRRWLRQPRAAVGKENDDCGGEEAGFETVPQRRKVVAVKDDEQ